MNCWIISFRERVIKKAKADTVLMLFITVDLDEQVVTKETKKDRN